MAVKTSENWVTPELERYYVFAEDDLCSVWYVGLLAYVESNGEPVKNPLVIAHMAIDKRLDHNKLYGFFKVVVLDKRTGLRYFWGDNSGSKRFYYCLKQGVIADTFPTCVQKLTERITPCYEAIYQYLTIERNIDDKTIVDGVQMTSRESVYTLDNGKISVMNKALLPLSELDSSFNLEKLMKILTAQIENKQVSAIVTGGTDSRCVLAHLIDLGYFPNLLITGRADSKDVMIAKKIADILHLRIDVYNPIDKESNWLQRAFTFSNGIYDVVLSYRHLRKAELTCNNSITYEFGGVGGEFYKNAYCRPFRYAQLFRRLTGKDIVDHTISNGLSSKAWFGDEVAKLQEQVYKNICVRISERMEKGFLRNYNIFAGEMLACGFCAITDNMTPFYTKLDPLMDRNLIASVCYMNPISLSMARWQRREIYLHCPQLSEIETDQGLSCSLRIIRLLTESFEKLSTYLELALHKFQRILQKKDKSEISQWKQDYLEARTMPEYIESVEICKQLGIVSKKAIVDNIPLDKTGFILMIGMFFKQYGGV